MRTAEALTASMPVAISGLSISVATDWHRAATRPSPTPISKRPRVCSQPCDSSSRLPQSTAIITPPTSSALPTSAQPWISSPRNNQASSAENIAWVANSTPERRGPRRFMQANSAVSPMKMPTTPERPSRPTAAASRSRQPPPAKASAQRIALANSMRQRLKANAPRRCAGGAEKRLDTAQLAAATTASASGLKRCSAGPPQAVSAHSGGSDPRSGRAWGPWPSSRRPSCG